jgi:hypothetical protein
VPSVQLGLRGVHRPFFVVYTSSLSVFLLKELNKLAKEICA